MELFEKYRQTPEYRLVNKGMSLDAFKGIFWWEYVHRLLGRLLGLAFLAPMLWFFVRRMVDRTLGLKLIGIFVLGSLQGAMGWYMVKSGLVDDPRVSHFRLTAHLGLAFLIFAAMFWVALDLLRGGGPPSAQIGALRRKLARAALALVCVVFLMVLSGGLVAGIRAGLAYNTFPLMNGHLVPPEIFMIEPWYLNFFNNMATVQFNHRLLALVLAAVTVALLFACRQLEPSDIARTAVNWWFAALAVQIILGVTTLLLRVPVALAAAHQGGAIMVFATALWLAHALRHRVASTNDDEPPASV